MGQSVTAVVASLEGAGLLRRGSTKRSDERAAYVSAVIGRSCPPDLAEFYGASVAQLADFPAILPEWTIGGGWRSRHADVTALLHVDAVPIFLDGAGSFYGADLSDGGGCAVYFFDHDDGFARPRWAAGSSIATFLRLLAEHDRAIEEGRPKGWELSIDPDLVKCSRAPPIWLAG